MSSNNSKIIFYGTEGCHLCDEARDLLDLVLSSMSVQVDYPYVDIAEDEQLMDRYGTIIPVIKAAYSKQELFWPFDDGTLTKFIRKVMK